MISVLGAVSGRRQRRPMVAPSPVLDPYGPGTSYYRSQAQPAVLDPYTRPMPAVLEPYGMGHEERALALIRVGDYVGALRAYGAARAVGPAVAADMALARILSTRCT